MVEVTRATREKSKLRIALAGVSGGGKTLGALLLASGLPAQAAPAAPDWPSRMGQLADLMRADGVTEGELRAVVGASGNYPDACDPTDYEQGFVDFLVAQ